MYHLAYNWADKEVHGFLKDIISKINVWVWLDVTLADFEAAVQYFIKCVCEFNSTNGFTI